MQLVFISREEYKSKNMPPGLLSPGDYVIPEGGYGELGAKGAATILEHCPDDFTHYCCAVGTGTMMAGLVNALSGEQQVIGVSVLKNNMELEKMIASLVQGNGSAQQDDNALTDAHKANWQLVHDFHFGGYAKYQPALLEFMNDFYQRTGIPSDFVYTGKLFYAVSYLIREKRFPPGSKILLVHSGGLQGNSSLRKGTLMF
jgi:1-aminocyclopropane-1-carboxylate deaminase